MSMLSMQTGYPRANGAKHRSLRSGRGLLILLGYLQPDKCEHSGVQIHAT